MMEYMGYSAIVEIDEEAGILHGRVLGLRDVITFQGESVREARKAFEESVDDYLEFCKARGEVPDKPYSGKFLVRVDPALHRIAASRAEATGMSLNAFVEKALTELVSERSEHASQSVVHSGATHHVREQSPKVS